jgi:transcriptional regulator with XRE-family HTH domain
LGEPAKILTLQRSGLSDARPGAALRKIRTKMGWTLAEVSRRTGLPVSTLSKVENDKMSLSYDKLARICTGLNIDISMLFGSEASFASAEGVSGRRCITRAGEGKFIETETYHHLYPAADLLNKRFVPIVADIKARSIDAFSEFIRHPGEEYAYVLEGAVELHTELYAPVLLKAGDSIYFDSGMGHAYVAVAPGRCRVLGICSGSESQLIAATKRDTGADAPATPQKQGTTLPRGRRRSEKP